MYEAAGTALMETEFIDTTQRDDTDRRTVRWLVFAGDRMPPSQKRTFDGMALGGDNLGTDYKTLAPTKGLLRRCQFTPMVIGHDDLNSDSLGDDKGRYKSRQHFDTEARQTVTTYFNECLPGDELAGLFTACQGRFDYGIREIEVLRGIEPTKKVNGELKRSPVDAYQREVFPDWDRYLLPEGNEDRIEFFQTTASLRTFLLRRREEVSPQAQGIISAIIDSLTQFERWATSQLDAHSRLVKAPPTADGKVYSWEQIHHQWFDALELNKEAFLMKKEEPRESDAPTRAEFLEYQRQNSHLLSQMAETNQRLAEIAISREMPPTSRASASPDKKVCADFNGKGEPCGAKVVKEIDGVNYCTNHPKDGEKADDIS